MRKFKCSICGFTYDEAAGLPEIGIAPGTKWEDIPHDFLCPWCGAPKSAFEEMKEHITVAASVTSEEVQQTYGRKFSQRIRIYAPSE